MNANRRTIVDSAGLGLFIGTCLSLALWGFTGCGQKAAVAPASTNRVASVLSPPLPQSMAAAVLRSPPADLVAQSNTPFYLAAAANEPKLGKLRFTWKASDPAAVGYKVYYWRQNQSTQWYQFGPVTNGTVYSLDEGEIYSYAATTVYPNGMESTWSPIGSQMTAVNVELVQKVWSAAAVGVFGRTNEMQTSSNLSEWRTLLTWTGSGVKTNINHTNEAQAWFRVVVK